jgi:hypothetical protein
MKLRLTEKQFLEAMNALANHELRELGHGRGVRARLAKNAWQALGRAWQAALTPKARLYGRQGGPLAIEHKPPSR